MREGVRGRGWGRQKKMEEKEVKKTAGTTDCFRFLVSASDLLELFRTDCDIEPLASTSLGNHNVPLQAMSCFPHTTICRHLILVAAMFVWLICRRTEVVRPLSVWLCTGFCFPFFSGRPL